MLTIIVVSTFVSIAFIVMGIYWLVFRPVSATAQRLHELDESGFGIGVQSIEADSMESLAARVAEPINRLLPPSAVNAKKLQLKLMQAGFPYPSAPAIYRATQFSLMLILPGIAFIGYAMAAQPLSDALLPMLA